MISNRTKKIVPIFPIGSLEVLKGCNQVSAQPSLLQAEQAQLSQPVLIGEVLQPLDHFCSPPLDPLQQFNVLLVLRAPELNTTSSVFGPEAVDTFFPKCVL